MATTCDDRRCHRRSLLLTHRPRRRGCVRHDRCRLRLASLWGTRLSAHARRQGHLRGVSVAVVWGVDVRRPSRARHWVVMATRVGRVHGSVRCDRVRCRRGRGGRSYGPTTGGNQTRARRGLGGHGRERPLLIGLPLGTPLRRAYMAGIRWLMPR
jgi:hypothetical protein